MTKAAIQKSHMIEAALLEKGLEQRDMTGRKTHRKAAAERLRDYEGLDWVVAADQRNTLQREFQDLVDIMTVGLEEREKQDCMEVSGHMVGLFTAILGKIRSDIVLTLGAMEVIMTK